MRPGVRAGLPADHACCRMQSPARACRRHQPGGSGSIGAQGFTPEDVHRRRGRRPSSSLYSTRPVGHRTLASHQAVEWIEEAVSRMGLPERDVMPLDCSASCHFGIARLVKPGSSSLIALQRQPRISKIRFSSRATWMPDSDVSTTAPAAIERVVAGCGQGLGASSAMTNGGLSKKHGSMSRRCSKTVHRRSAVFAPRRGSAGEGCSDGLARRGRATRRCSTIGRPEPMKALGGSVLAMGRIASDLGYSAQLSLNRAIRRWASLAPRDVRRNAGH